MKFRENQNGEALPFPLFPVRVVARRSKASRSVAATERPSDPLRAAIEKAHREGRGSVEIALDLSKPKESMRRIDAFERITLELAEQQLRNNWDDWLARGFTDESIKERFGEWRAVLKAQCEQLREKVRTARDGASGLVEVEIQIRDADIIHLR